MVSIADLLQNLEIDTVVGEEGEVRRDAGAWGMVGFAVTSYPVNDIFYTGNPPQYPGSYWEITIPRDTCYLNTCYAQTGGPIVAEPDEPIIVAPKGR